jgi:Flp pilus assembly protein CpaB
MKASSLFAVTVSVLLGLGAVAGAKYAGVFDRVETKPDVKVPIKVLVAAENLFEGITITGAQVRVRDLRPDEEDAYKRNKEKYLPALVAAAHMRIAARSIEADTPLLKEHFQDQSLPDEVSARMNRFMRAVTVALPKERCSGGLLRVGEYVDVLLTCQIAGGKDTDPIIQTAYLARGVKIIVKRNNLWSTLVSNPDNIPINFTLMANPYRAALLEFAKTAGNLTLVPVPVPPEAQIKLNNNARPTWGDANSSEYKDEDERVAAIERGELVVGARDLERLFKLQPMPVPPPQAVVKQDVIVHYNGLSQGRVTLLPPVTEKPGTQASAGARPLPNSDGKVKPAAAGLTSASERPALGYRFFSPDVAVPKSKGTPGGDGSCPECEAARKAQGG